MKCFLRILRGGGDADIRMPRLGSLKINQNSLLLQILAYSINAWSTIIIGNFMLCRTQCLFKEHTHNRASNCTVLCKYMWEPKTFPYYLWNLRCCPERKTLKATTDWDIQGRTTWSKPAEGQGGICDIFSVQSHHCSHTPCPLLFPLFILWTCLWLRLLL